MFALISKVFFIFGASLQIASTARILGIFPVPTTSHRNLHAPLMKELVQRGHDVTVISPYQEIFNETKGSYKTILLTGFVEWMEEGIKSLGSFDKAEKNLFQNFESTVVFVTKITEMTLAHNNVQKLIHSEAVFDIVIMVEVSNHAHKALAAYFRAPLVLFTTLGSSCLTNLMVANPAPPSYVPDMFSGFPPQMTFSERLVNAVMLAYTQIYMQWYVYPKHNELIKKYIPGGLEIEQVLYNASLVLLNSHPSVNQPVPHVPNMIEIGGFHIVPPKKLSTDLQQFIDNAPDGVIYFSMGSNLKSSNLPPSKRNAFLKTFAKLKQKIIWKWEDDVLPGQPWNVQLGKWLPQQDILAHSSVRLFITHGGLLSTTETIYHGVPVLIIPIFMDQKLNAKSAVNLGFGLSLAFEDVSEDSLTVAIGDLLSNPKYKENAKLRSSYFRDWIRHPMETAMYWIEYIIRYKGAPHLRVNGTDLPWYKYLLLDVLLFLLLLLVLGFSVFIILCRIVSCNNIKKMKIKTR